MPLSAEDLQKYVGQNLSDVKQQLEGRGCEVCEVRTGHYATGRVPIRPLVVGESQTEQPQPQRVVVVFNGDDPDKKITSIRQC
ncbi:unnamed protein product [Rotaria socialis]|uniref:Uncharacterized protein n=1 Tax=Rotaria socialis TaxID=392032 RepID=A0A819A0C5_9BILA|nr:unnamed protein product [Rotaria socialis]CAF3458174.1 unnamed protein product [Rotaria socialis]CAF3776287.1 unnamed protein product [Rotaria socialis]CAF4503726.1 unnamed protein product [Rotaria socialis]CAF4739220.1 unnamed protein product [Rotaria socialis]